MSSPYADALDTALANIQASHDMHFELMDIHRAIRGHDRVCMPGLDKKCVHPICMAGWLFNVASDGLAPPLTVAQEDRLREDDARRNPELYCDSCKHPWYDHYATGCDWRYCHCSRDEP